jgi:endonuclease YncB( thermonuclease family)
MRIAQCLAGVICTSGTALADDRVVDGDTLEVNGEKIRRYGIDAPEAGQACAKRGGGTWPCGKLAIRTVGGLVAGGELARNDRAPHRRLR